MQTGIGVLVCLAAAFGAAEGDVVSKPVPELVYPGELVSFPGAWSFSIGRSHIIFVSDEQLEALSDPDARVNLSLTTTPQDSSLREVCERAQAAGQRTLILAFDHFFAQYRPGQEGKPRRLMPDGDEYIGRIAAIGKFAAGYGLGLELSLLSPLEIGPGYREATGESGLWMHYREGLRDPESGAYSLELWRQHRWANNKGPLLLEDAGVRVFAFRERPVHGTPYSVVDPADIKEITEGVQTEVFAGLLRHLGDYEAVRVRVYGTGHPEAAGMDRVVVVQSYRTPEMDYFSDSALPYLKGLADKYVDAGVKLNGLYSDEMHIQQDWGYFSHHDHGEFALRYVSPGLAQRYAARWGDRYADFAKYLLYFVHGQADAASDLTAKSGAMHVFGEGSESIRETALFRARYYRMLQDGVTDLFVAAKRHIEERAGYRMEARAHATWAQSPTIDKWDSGEEPHPRHQYEYTSNFVWSNTVQQAASACYDYFKWGDFLTGNGNDHAEGGWLDRNYVGLTLACSTGILNDVPYSYGAHWGMPEEVSRRRSALVDTFGAAAWPPYAMVEGMQHRDVEVLMLYPMDLVAVEERFGSWMTQYGYANLISQDKLLERGEVAGGAIKVAGRRFTTLVALFEPFPEQGLLDMMTRLAEGGGRVIWSGPPPVLFRDGSNALDAWRSLTGVDYTPARNEGLLAPGKQVAFEGLLRDVPPMTVLTDFVVDHIYPVTPREGTQTAARMKDHVIGTTRATNGGGTITFLGFRPRDDQAASLGYETRVWFDVLERLGAYTPTGRFAGVNDNTEYLSRTTPYLVCRFPNGAVAIAPHLNRVEECWPGGFARDAEKDKAIVAQLTLPSERFALEDFRANGHTIRYAGAHAVAFRLDDAGSLSAFCGRDCDRIAVDGRETLFADQALGAAAWAPVDPERRVEGGAIIVLYFEGTGTVRVPALGLGGPVQVVTQGRTLGSRGTEVPSRLEKDALVFDIQPSTSNGWMYVVPAGAP